jgi:fumarate hydratase subunit beta
VTDAIRLTTPLTDDDVVRLKAGDRVRLHGTLLTGRDAAHKRLIDLLDEGKPLPIDVRGQIIYYVGPTPPPPGMVIGSAGPTTGGRMDKYAPRLMALGLKGMIGKGSRSLAVRDAMREHRCVYFGAVGGAGALLSKFIKAAEIVAYEDLGTEAIRQLTVEDFPVIVVNDAHGNDLYEEGMKQYASPTRPS